MVWWLVCLLMIGACAGGEKQQNSGITQFWTDDYKVFDQIYGKTSDKEIYGATLPPSIGYGIDVTKLKSEASEKKERFLENQQTPDFNEAQLDPYGFGSRYPGLLTNQALKKLVSKKPIKTPKFIASDFKPIISQNNDPETYNYLKHLELLQKQKEQFSQINIGGFKPYLSYAGSSPEDTDNYKSIQDILEAHEANKGKITENDETDDQVKYLTYGKGRNQQQSKVSKPRPPLDKAKPHCPSGRCRKRATTTYRGRTYLPRTYLRKIKHKIYKY